MLPLEVENRMLGLRSFVIPAFEGERLARTLERGARLLHELGSHPADNSRTLHTVNGASTAVRSCVNAFFARLEHPASAAADKWAQNAPVNFSNIDTEAARTAYGALITAMQGTDYA